MNKKTICALVLSLGLMLVSCSNEIKEKKTIIVKKSDIILKKIGVDGMTCVGCEVTLESAISKIEGVTTVKASASKANAVVEFDTTKTDVDTIIKTIQEAGYKAKR